MKPSAKCTIKFTVTGRGMFPYDMLRFACAWPASEADAETMRNRRDGQRSVTLVTDRGDYAQHRVSAVASRFKSFGWHYEAEQVV